MSEEGQGTRGREIRENAHPLKTRRNKPINQPNARPHRRRLSVNFARPTASNWPSLKEGDARRKSYAKSSGRAGRQVQRRRQTTHVLLSANLKIKKRDTSASSHSPQAAWAMPGKYRKTPVHAPK